MGLITDAFSHLSKYDPAMLPDHGGPQFRHVNAKVVQYDVRDKDFNLIPPWEFLNSLHADTLFVAAVELLVWDIAPNERMRKRTLLGLVHGPLSSVTTQAPSPLPPRYTSSSTSLLLTELVWYVFALADLAACLACLRGDGVGYHHIRPDPTHSHQFSPESILVPFTAGPALTSSPYPVPLASTAADRDVLSASPRRQSSTPSTALHVVPDLPAAADRARAHIMLLPTARAVLQRSRASRVRGRAEKGVAEGCEGDTGDGTSVFDMSATEILVRNCQHVQQREHEETHEMDICVQHKLCAKYYREGAARQEPRLAADRGRGRAAAGDAGGEAAWAGC
ncbi:hypothetical protein DENSPDRAFT_853338 [Dentipellis sp. KUC8613]|nr:hypothetical protein DENSPDRAFT_853338 [Dentipellis sp. KUC8613]